ncbi:MAG: transglutaminase [Planctomycetaceae bacterium]|nr:transglutaminase [Planctomycetaceae bacterium]
MAHYRIVHTTNYDYSDPVPVCHNQLHLSPRDTDWSRCTSHRLAIDPTPMHVSRRSDWFGNYVKSFSLQENHQKLCVTARSRVEVTPQAVPGISDAPSWEKIASRMNEQTDECIFRASEFLYDSPHISRGEAFREFAAECFNPGDSILAATIALTSKIHGEFQFGARATTVTTRPEEVLVSKHGVCQDFAHLAISSLRSLGIPARYVSGYLRTTPPAGQPRLIGADASHAWFSVFCGEHGWIDFDPTNNRLCDTDHIPIAWGRDYSDVTPVRGVFIGGGNHTLTVSVDVEPIAN